MLTARGYVKPPPQFKILENTLGPIHRNSILYRRNKENNKGT